LKIYAPFSSGGFWPDKTHIIPAGVKNESEVQSAGVILFASPTHREKEAVRQGRRTALSAIILKENKFQNNFSRL
jgi:hypothetical protein